jgi:hypothetical protein
MFNLKTKRQAVRGSLTLIAVLLLAVIGPTLAEATAGAVIPQRASHGPAAVAARSESLNETAQLRVVSRHGIIFNEQGPASGTFRGTLTLLLTAKVTRVSIQFSANPSGGTLRGEGSANVQAQGAIGRVNGIVSITGGSGRYAHAHGSGLAITGTVDRHNYNLSIRVTGTMSY